MATYKVIDSYPPFEYGSAVRWRRGDLPMLVGSICGFRVVNRDKELETASSSRASVVVLVEEHSGGTVEVPLDELELI